jgi:hypothetical protein
VEKLQRKPIRSRYVLSDVDADRFEKEAKKFAAKATTSAKKARETLVALGIYTPSGKLCKRYS